MLDLCNFFEVVFAEPYFPPRVQFFCKQHMLEQQRAFTLHTRNSLGNKRTLFHFAFQPAAERCNSGLETAYIATLLFFANVGLDHALDFVRLEDGFLPLLHKTQVALHFAAKIHSASVL